MHKLIQKLTPSQIKLQKLWGLRSGKHELMLNEPCKPRASIPSIYIVCTFAYHNILSNTGHWKLEEA